MKLGKIYVASSLDNKERVKEIISDLAASNIEVTYDWTTHGRVYDPNALKEIAQLEEKGVIDCQLFLMVLPGGGGTHFEFGVARTLNKIIVILEESQVEQKSFYYLDDIYKYESYEQAKEDILNKLSRINALNATNK